MTTHNLLYVTGTSIIIADSTDYNPTAARTLGARTDQIDVTSLAAAAARQSDKIDFGATRAMLYDVRINFEMATDPSSGGTIGIYVSPSHSGTANVGNVAHCTGSDASYAAIAGYTLGELLAQLQIVAIVPVAVQNDADGVQCAHAGVFSPTDRYASIVIHNNTDAAFHNDADEFAIGFFPIIAQGQ